MMTRRKSEAVVQADCNQLIGPLSATANSADLLTSASHYSQKQIQSKEHIELHSAVMLPPIV